MRRNPLSYLAAAVIIAGLATTARRALDGVAGQSPSTTGGKQSISLEEGSISPSVEVTLGPPIVTLDEQEACRDVGYLCRGLVWDGPMARAYRWDSDTRLIRVRVPLPAGDAARARAVQEAAKLGVLAWHGHPFPILVEDRDRGSPADITIEWMEAPPGNQLGQASTRWTRQGVKATLEVAAFRLALASPASFRPPSPRQIELTAAHEMGHALGLPHSDKPRDVIYPTNTATTLSTEDYRAMEALYRLPNGVGIWREPGP